MKSIVISAISTLFLIVLVGCVPEKTGPARALSTRNSLSTSSGNASIVLKEDGTIEIRGSHIEVVSSGKLILVGKTIEENSFEEARSNEENPIEEENGNFPDETPEETSKEPSNAEMFMSTSDIFEIVYMNDETQAGGEAQTLPLPTKKGETVYIVVLCYKEPYHLGKEIVYPPHRKITINPETGEVIENKAVTPVDFGMPQASMEPTEGFGLDPNLTSSEFWSLTNRFFEISPLVWEMYKNESTHPSSQNLVILREYHSIFNRVAKAPLVPYYKAIAPDLFDWSSKVLN